MHATWGRKIASGLTVALLLGLPGEASATISLSVGTCNSTYCEFNVTADESVEVIVGGYYVSGNYYNGVCVKDADDNCEECERASTDTSDVRVFGSESTDLMRLAERTGGELCGAIRIYGTLDDASDRFMLWGNGGNDEIYVCDYRGGTTSPATTDCLTWTSDHNAGRADGRDDDDYLYGSPYEDELYGEDGTDHIYTFDNYDYIHAGPGDDYLFSGPQCDLLDGSTGYDYCNCGPYANDGQDEGDRCEWEYNCGACSDPDMMEGGAFFSFERDSPSGADAGSCDGD